VPKSDEPIRVAVIGAGPAGFYVAEQLLARAEPRVTVDMFERLPTPYGLVRYGVAPDHPKIKTVTKSFDKTAQHAGFRFFGNVTVGQDVRLADLQRHYHAICFTTGAQTDKRMGIPGEDLARSHAATEFVAWYNGHPGYRHRQFDLSVERVAIVGVGNVAVDVARILCRTPEELAETDIADHALEALRRSRVREVTMLGRRGAAQAAFTNAEVKELGELPGADVTVRSDELDAPGSAVAEGEDRAAAKKLEILRQFATRQPSGKPRLLTLRFLVSPVELLPDAAGGVAGVRLVRNALKAGPDGTLKAEPTGAREDLPAQMVFRSVGYHGVPLPDLPFDAKRGVVPNAAGRVLDPSGKAVPGLYVSGWIKRGPSGVIGTNKPDAADTVAALLEDAAAGRLLPPADTSASGAEALVRSRQPRVVTYDGWRVLDQLEVAAGRPDRPRRKFTAVDEMLAALAAAPRP
jgi:ferredoxin--NADP+ reductase